MRHTHPSTLTRKIKEVRVKKKKKTTPLILPSEFLNIFPTSQQNYAF